MKKGMFIRSSLFFAYCCVAWGSSGMVSRTVLAGYPTCTSFAMRMMLAAALAMICKRLWARSETATSEQRKKLFQAAFIQGFAALAGAFAAPYVLGGISMSVLTLQPVTVMAVNFYRHREKTISRINLMGGIIAVEGVFSLYLYIGGLSVTRWWAIPVYAGSAVLFGLAYFPITAAGKLNPFVKAQLLITSQAAMAAPLMLIELACVCLGWIQPPSPSIKSTVAWLCLSIFCSYVPYVAFCYLIEHWGPVKTSIQVFFFPLVALGEDFIWEKESMALDTESCISIVTILFGITLVILKRELVIPAIAAGTYLLRSIGKVLGIAPRICIPEEES